VYQAPRGTQDILPQDQAYWRFIEEKAEKIGQLYGYKRIDTPVFEDSGLFVRTIGSGTDIVEKEMYTFIDKGGRSITLRPEYTPSVARAIIEHRLDLLPEPMRYYFIGPMFRFDKPQKGRFRQFHQIDIEVFGENDPAIDAEIIEMADELLKKLKVRDTEVLVNSVGCRRCRPAYLKDLRAHAPDVVANLGDHLSEMALLKGLWQFNRKMWFVPSLSISAFTLLIGSFSLIFADTAGALLVPGFGQGAISGLLHSVYKATGIVGGLLGLIGYLMRKFEFPLAPVILGLVLGDLLEQSIRQP
jgi:hypothetical protein